MQLTIDSNEPLEQVLEVVGSLYGVRLSATRDGDAAPASSAPRARKRADTARATRKAPSGGRPRARAGAGSAKIDTAAVRGWARSNGHAVSERGRLPGAVLAAYMSRKRTRAS